MLQSLTVVQYLDEFSRSLAREVRQLLTEVTTLVDEKTRIQLCVLIFHH